MPTDLDDALGHLDQDRRGVRTIYIDDYAIDDQGVEQLDRSTDDAGAVDPLVPPEAQEPRPVMWPAIALVTLVTVVALLIAVL